MNEKVELNKQMKQYTLIRQALGFLGAHLAGVILSLIFVIGLSGLITKNALGAIIAELLILLIYSFPVYSAMWEYGHKDLNRFNYGHIKRDQARGFKIALVGTIPVFVLSVLLILSKFKLFYNIVILFKIINAEIWPIMNLIQPSAYLDKFSVGQIIAVALLPVIPVILAGVGYILGNHDCSPLQKLVYKNAKKKPAKEKKVPEIKSKY